MICSIIIFIKNYNSFFRFDLHRDLGLSTWSTTHFALEYIENMPAFPPQTISLWISFLPED